jgi:hypothetical protein
MVRVQFLLAVYALLDADPSPNTPVVDADRKSPQHSFPSPDTVHMHDVQCL